MRWAEFLLCSRILAESFLRTRAARLAAPRLMGVPGRGDKEYERCALAQGCGVVDKSLLMCAALAVKNNTSWARCVV